MRILIDPRSPLGGVGGALGPLFPPPGGLYPYISLLFIYLFWPWAPLQPIGPSGPPNLFWNEVAKLVRAIFGFWCHLRCQQTWPPEPAEAGHETETERAAL